MKLIKKFRNGTALDRMNKIPPLKFYFENFNKSYSTYNNQKQSSESTKKSYRPTVTKRRFTDNKAINLEKSVNYNIAVNTEGISNAVNQLLGTNYTDEQVRKLATDGTYGIIHQAINHIAVNDPSIALERNQEYQNLLNSNDIANRVNARLGTNYTVDQIKKLATDKIMGKVHDALGNMLMQNMGLRDRSKDIPYNFEIIPPFNFS